MVQHGKAPPALVGGGNWEYPSDLCPDGEISHLHGQERQIPLGLMNLEHIN